MSSRLDPTSSTTESATSPTMSDERKRPPRAEDEPRTASFSASTNSPFELASSAPTRPATAENTTLG